VLGIVAIIIPGFLSILFVSLIMSFGLLFVRKIFSYFYLVFHEPKSIFIQNEKAKYKLYLFEWTFYMFSISALQLLYHYFESPSKVFLVVFVILSCSIVPSFNFIIRPLVLFLQKNIRRAAPDIENWVHTNIDPSIKVYIQNGNLTNAFAEGVVPMSKTIIIGNNLIKGLKKEQVRAVIFHETGHLELNHIPIYYLTNIIASCLFCFTVLFLYRLSIQTVLLQIVLVGLTGAVCGALFYSFLPGLFLKKLEYEADQYAANRIGFNLYKQTLEKIDAISGGLLRKGDISHPTLNQRIKMMEKYKSISN